MVLQKMQEVLRGVGWVMRVTDVGACLRAKFTAG